MSEAAGSNDELGGAIDENADLSASLPQSTFFLTTGSTALGVGVGGGRTGAAWGVGAAAEMPSCEGENEAENDLDISESRSACSPALMRFPDGRMLLCDDRSIDAAAEDGGEDEESVAGECGGRREC